MNLMLRPATLVAAMTMLALSGLPGSASGQTVYRCKTATGIVYSQLPCADDAERREVKAPATAGSAGAAAATRAFVDIGADLLAALRGSAGEVRARLGDPAASYRIDEAEYWLYEHVGRIEDGQRQLAELRVVNDRAAQVNWMAEDVMRRGVIAARSFAGWQAPAGPRTKTIYATGKDLRGNSKAGVLALYGEPDVKKIFQGTEVWEYRGVPISRENPQLLTLYVEFEAGRVSVVNGN